VCLHIDAVVRALELLIEQDDGQLLGNGVCDLGCSIGNSEQALQPVQNVAAEPAGMQLITADESGIVIFPPRFLKPALVVASQILRIGERLQLQGL